MTMYWPYLTWVWYIRYTRACRDTPISASTDTGSKVGNTITSNSVYYFSFSPAVRIPPPPVLLWHPAHCVHSWEHWPPPLWEWTRGVYMLWQSVCIHTRMIFVWLYTTSHSKITVSPVIHVSHGHTYTLTAWLYTSSLVLQFHLLCTLYGWLHMTLILFDQFPNQHMYVHLCLYPLDLYTYTYIYLQRMYVQYACIIHILHKVNYKATFLLYRLPPCSMSSSFGSTYIGGLFIPCS